jgi:DNA processing protein
VQPPELADVLGVAAEGPLAEAPDRPEAERVDRAAERDAWAILASAHGLGPVGFANLLRRLGSGRAILRLAGSDRAVEQLVSASAGEAPDGADGPRALTEGVAGEIVRAAEDADRTLGRIRELGLQVVTVDDPAYPSRLAAIELPPHLLFVYGDPAVLEPERAVAVVGTRRASNAGRATASRVAAALSAAGASVVSGLAVGIDGAAHAAALDAGGRTVAVIGGGHGHLYPRAHTRLADAIAAGGGAVVSELAPDLAPTAGTFPRRNRIISGLADATVVIEAPARSGALITASWALEQGRDCLLVPGAIDDPAYAGCIAFLREFPGGARIVAGVPQLIEDLGLATRPAAAGATKLAGATLLELGETAARVAEELLAGRATVDELVAATGWPVATVLATLTVLERNGLAVGVVGRFRPAGTLAIATPQRRRRH